MIEYEAMMYSILKKYGLYNKREDYIDICYIGYSKALKKYDSSKSKPATYFYKCIENEILQFLRRENAQKRQYEESSMDYVYDNHGHDLNDIISDNVNIEEDYIIKEQQQELFISLNKLNNKEKLVIKYCFGIGCDELKQDEIAKMLGVTQTQISRIKSKALLKLRGAMENEWIWNLKRYTRIWKLLSN